MIFYSTIECFDFFFHFISNLFSNILRKMNEIYIQILVGNKIHKVII